MVATFILSACGGPPDIEDRFPVDGEIITLSGTIEKLELNLYTEGTHQLHEEDDSVVLLKSRTVNLNHYVDEEVSVEGTIETSKIEIGRAHV